GHGDAIMAMRYLPEIKRRAEVTLVIDEALARLAQRFDVNVTTKVPDDLTGFDARLPLFGAMSALGASATTIPAAPYIHPLVWQPQSRDIGIAWCGRTQIMFSLEYFLMLLAHQGFRLHALQPG